MSDTDDEHLPSDANQSPADVFALVGNEIRAEIIQVLGEDPDEDELSFGELRARLDSDVEPSQLYYHLQQLVGHFIENTDGAYTLHPAGSLLCLSLRAGTLNHHQEQLSVETDVNCYYCQAPVEALFDNRSVSIDCSDCEYHYGGDLLEFPLKTFENPMAAFSHFKEYMTLRNLSRARGVCPSCAHLLSPEFQFDEECPCPRKVLIDPTCNRCGANWRLTLGQALLPNSELIAFCHDHGVDVLTTPYWELEFAATDKHVTIRSTDPWEVAIEVSFDDETLELVVDEDLNVIERNRMAASGTDEIVLPDKDTCIQSLRRHRWPDGVTCPNCNSPITNREGKTSKDIQRYKCSECDIFFNDLTETVFADQQLTIPEMFHIIRKMDEMEKTKIAQQLDRAYSSVLDFVHKVEETTDDEFDSDLSDVCDSV